MFYGGYVSLLDSGIVIIDLDGVYVLVPDILRDDYGQYLEVEVLIDIIDHKMICIACNIGHTTAGSAKYAEDDGLVGHVLGF